MNSLSIINNKLQKHRRFRILAAKIYPLLVKSGIMDLLHFFNKGSFSDVWGIDKSDEINNSLPLKKYDVDFTKLIKLKKNYTIGFIYLPMKRDTDNIIRSCDTLGINYILYNILSPSVYSELRETKCDAIVIFPSHDNNLIRSIFHEFAQIAGTEMDVLFYPTIRELNIYEAKRTLANFLSINNIPHPETVIFYNLETAKTYLENAKYPIVFKTHIGASSNGVEILINKKQAIQLARHLFNSYYLRKMESESRAIEWGYILLQEYIIEAKEYRIIKIGDSWFGYQKWKDENQLFMSGSGVLKWIDPSAELLNFCFNIATEHHFTTMCFDIFENKQGDLLVNELQTWFGSYDPTEMYVNNIPGRYRRIDGKWNFEPGMYNVNGSITLRLVDLISILQHNE